MAGCVQMSMILLATLSALYVLCYLGDLVTHRFLEVADKAYRTSWTFLPLDQQKKFIIIIAMAQKRVYVRGYAQIRSTREIFMNVI